GIRMAPEAIATQLGIEGIVVLRVFPNTPAARAGIKGVNLDAGELGDVIVEVGGKKIHRPVDFAEELDRAGVGGKIQLKLKRDDKEYSVELAVVDTARAAPGASDAPTQQGDANVGRGRPQ